MGILRKLASESAIYGLSSILGRFLNYLLVPLHTHVFTNPGEYGAVTEIYAYISFLVIVYTYGMETSFFHFARKYPERTSQVFGTGMISLLISTLVFSGSLLLFSDSLAEALNYQAHPEYIVYMALIIGFDALTSIPFAKLRQEGKARKFAALKLFGIGVNILFNVLFFLVFPVWLSRETGILFELAKQFYNPETGAGYVFIANLLASIATLFEHVGEAGFREREKATLHELLAGHGQLISTGGGAVLDADNRDTLRTRGFVVYLPVDVATQLVRLADDLSRPLLARPDREQVLQDLAALRTPLYREVADLVFDTTGLAAEDAAARLAGRLATQWMRQGATA